MAQYLTCTLCGFEFEKADTLCVHGCPLGPMCNLIRCPNCEYEFLETPRRLSWLRGLLGKTQTAPLHRGLRTVKELAIGEHVAVRCVAGRPARRESLAVFGLVPGAEITLLQQRPSCVVRIGETELALDPAIAREILIEPLPE